MNCSYVVYFESNFTNTIRPIKVFGHPFNAMQFCYERAFKTTNEKGETIYINSTGKYYIKMVPKKVRRPN